MLENKIESDNLLPCPCCGGEVILGKAHSLERTPLNFIHCRQCWIRTEARVDKNRVIECWNKRVQSNFVQDDDKYYKAVRGLICIAEGNPCLCNAGCPRCDAIETLQEIGESYERVRKNDPIPNCS